MMIKRLAQGVVAFQASELNARLGSLMVHYEQLKGSFADLVQDYQMGDGGEYRFRRYSRFLNPGGDTDGAAFRLVEGNSIIQSLADNSLNGGRERTYEPLAEGVRLNPLFRALVEHDIEVVRNFDEELFSGPVLIGVHQVRIVALPEMEGKPTPEGVHRDAERFTFQHLWHREAVDGGEFRAYDEARNLSFSWLQESPLDSVLFEGSTWHSASPIRCRDGSARGHRDIFLIDFEPY